MTADTDVPVSENHRRVLQSAFAHLDSLLSGIESTLAGSAALFPRHHADLSPTQRKVVTDSVAQLRSQMREALRALGIEIPAPEVKASWAIQTALTMADVALQEMGPSYLRGYGEVGAPDALEVLIGDLRRAFRRLGGFLARGPAAELGERIRRLDAAPELAALPTLERIITGRGLVEFRGALHALLEQIESKTYEIAMFGRVSCGKSSLLNAVLDTDVLPVGVNPVTAVATRIVWGEAAQARIAFADGREEIVPATRLSEFVAEDGNADNRKGVARVTVSIPSPALRAGVAFVDTPGVGSLATSGARETQAYLPRCDLGVLLIDAGSAPAPEDLGILRLLHDSGIPSLVLISKADLLPAPDREKMRDYLSTAIGAQLGIETPVQAVSSVGDARALARDWFAREIALRCERAAALVDASVCSKLRALQEGVAAALHVMLEASRGQRAAQDTREMPDLRALALEAEGVLHEVERACFELADLARYADGLALRQALRDVVQRGREVRSDPAALAEILRRAVGDAQEQVRAPMRHDLLQARDRLRNILSRMAAPFPFVVTRAGDIAPDLVTQPLAELPSSCPALRLRWPRWLGAFPSTLQRSLARQLERQIGPALQATFQSCGKELRAWSRSAVARLSEQFAAQAEPIRAYVRRLTEIQQSAPDERELAADLEALRNT